MKTIQRELRLPCQSVEKGAAEYRRPQAGRLRYGAFSTDCYRRGITLIMVAGVLAILAALGAGFYTITVAQAKSSVNYSDATRAILLAQGGMADAISRMRESTYIKTEDPGDGWFGVNYNNNKETRPSFAEVDKKITNNKERIPGDWKAIRKPYSRALGNSANNREGGSDQYVLKVSDAAGKINVNAGDNLAVVLDNLCRVIGPPLTSANLDYLQPYRWYLEGADQQLYGRNTSDTLATRNLYYKPDQAPGTQDTAPQTDPTNAQVSLYGDGYAIARYRSAHGRFNTVEELKNALTFVIRPGHPELEVLERELKFAALRDYVTIDSWVDTSTICSGKFEWADPTSSSSAIAIDRDKSWIADDPTDTLNRRGSLRGCYVSILNGHGAGQLRRIKTNGIDWIELDGGSWQYAPGPISSYMIIAKEDAKVGGDGLPVTDAQGKLIDDPDIDYKRYPLCIHRAPVNVNTASDRVLMALMLNINIQHGTPMAIGTDADYSKIVRPTLPDLYQYSATGLTFPGAGTDWKALDSVLLTERYLLTPKGLKRVPANSGKPVLDRPAPFDNSIPEMALRYGYLNNYDSLGTPQFVAGSGGKYNEVHELAYRIIVARQPDADEPYIDPVTGYPKKGSADGFAPRGPFKTWDDLYFRVVKPWDDKRLKDSPGKKIPIARLFMAHFNTNTDILKFNPNIEWIDRWGRNFSEMETVMIFDGDKHGPRISNSIHPQARPVGNKNDGAKDGAYYIRGRRYQFDEMIDQTDMNRSTTQFIFDSNGIYDIQCVGQVVKDGTVVAERKLGALVKLYDVWRETTQRQFVSGTFSNALQKNKNGLSTGFTDAGRVTRDATNVNNAKGLDTYPEALVPLKWSLSSLDPKLSKIAVPASLPGRSGVPDIVSNKVLPANYDGQIVLASNQTGYDPNLAGDADAFLASFNGDLDTGTAKGNGRELAMTPQEDRPSVRVVDTIGLLGMLMPTGGITEVDVDPKAVVSFWGETPQADLTTKFDGADTRKNRLDPVTGKEITGNDGQTPYWLNVQMRMGDLRPDGVFLGACGLSGKDATLKYEMTENFPAKTTNAITINFWMKSNWRVNDGYEHEFFNATDMSNNKTVVLSKGRQFAGTFSGDSGASNRVENRNSLVLSIEDTADDDHFVGLHDGERAVQEQYVAVPGKIKSIIETPTYKVQPFRWSNVGTTMGYNTTVAGETTYRSEYQGGGLLGFMQGPQDGGHLAYAKDMLLSFGHPFIDTQRYPEGSVAALGGSDNTWSAYYWLWRWANASGMGASTADGQPLTSPVIPGQPQITTRVFSINAPQNDIGRVVPSTGTEAVIDEYKISGKVWSTRRIGEEQTLSRYYLPGNPGTQGDCPTFTSQTLLQSVRGADTGVRAEDVTLARVSWTVFTPRFMHENKGSETQSRNEYASPSEANAPANAVPQLRPFKFRGPFDYVQYNREIGYDALQGWKSLAANPRKPSMDVECERKPPLKYPGDYAYNSESDQPHYSRGVEVELLNDYSVVGKTYTDPTVQNSVGTTMAPIRVRSDVLRYRVRFRYPVDNARVDKNGGKVVNATTQYLLDTPVFDDISITYFTAPRILSYKDLSE